MEIDENNIELLVSGIGSLVADKNGVWVKNGDDAICVLWEDVIVAQHTLAGGLACTCAKVRFYPDENVFDEACPIHGTQAAKA